LRFTDSCLANIECLHDPGIAPLVDTVIFDRQSQVIQRLGQLAGQFPKRIIFLRHSVVLPIPGQVYRLSHDRETPEIESKITEFTWINLKLGVYLNKLQFSFKP